MATRVSDHEERQTIGGGALAFDGERIAQLRLLLLIATPVQRVAFTLVAFGLQGDRRYVVTTSIVLSLLVYALLFGKA